MLHFAFTKLVVADLDASEAFYTSVFGLTPVHRVSSAIGAREIDEVLFQQTAPGAGTFVLLRYRDSDRPRNDEVIVGFVVPDADDTLARVAGAGGAVTSPAVDMPEHGARVGFATDPEGHLLEIVQVLGAG